MPSSPLANQVVLITGASSGIGAGLAAELRDAGMKLVLTARRTDRLEALAKKLGECEVVAADIADEATPQLLVDRAVERFGRLDVVFNSAGVMFAATIDDVDIDEMCRMVRINSEAATRMAYTALKYFKSVGSGHLMNVSSILGT